MKKQVTILATFKDVKELYNILQNARMNIQHGAIEFDNETNLKFRIHSDDELDMFGIKQDLDNLTIREDEIK